MMKITFAVAIAAAVLMPATLLVGAIPAEAQNLKMAQGVDVQIGRDRDDRDRRRRNDSDVTVGVGRRCHHRPTAKLSHGHHYGRTGRRPHNHAQRAPLRLNDTEERKWPRSRGHFVCVERTVVVSENSIRPGFAS
jgi:uncharacterized protein (UPF0548 family)